MQMIDVLKRLAELDAKNPNVVKEHGIADTVNQNPHAKKETVVEGTRLLGRKDAGNRSVSLYRNTDWNEYIVQFFVDGEHQKDADYHTDDKPDAVSTANAFLKGFPKKELDEGQTPMDVKDTDGKSVGIYYPGQGFRPNEHGRKTHGLLPTDKVPAKFNFKITPQTSLPKVDKAEESRKFTNLGPGDEATWPAYSGHPNDPRNPGWDDDDELSGLQDLRDELKRSLDSDEFDEDNVRGKSLEELPLSNDLIDWLSQRNKELNLNVSNPSELYDLLHGSLDEMEKEIKSYGGDDYPEPDDDSYYYDRYEESLKECADMMTPPMQPKTPASINMTAGSGEELSNMLKDIMSLAGVHKVEPDHLGHDHEPKIMSTPPTIGVVSHNGGSDLMRSMMDKLNDTDADMDREEPIKELDNTPDEEIKSPSEGPLGQNGPAYEPNTPGAAKGRALMANPHGTVEEQLMAEWKNFISESQTERQVTEKRSVPKHKAEKDKETTNKAHEFTAKGGKVTQLPYKEPKEKTNWGSKHIGTGKGSRGEQLGTGAKSSPRKPVVGEPAAKSEKPKKSDKKHDK